MSADGGGDANVPFQEVHMGSFSTRTFGWTAAIGIVLLAAGCTATYINFEGPPGTVMFVDDKPYHLPSQIELWRPAGKGESNRFNVSLVFNTSQSGEVHATGHIDVFGYTESDIDKMVANSCKLDESQLDVLVQGKILVYKGQTASRQPLYELTLTKK
jgi:hypothetical protein